MCVCGWLLVAYVCWCALLGGSSMVSFLGWLGTGSKAAAASMPRIACGAAAAGAPNQFFGHASTMNWADWQTSSTLRVFEGIHFQERLPDTQKLWYQIAACRIFNHPFSAKAPTAFLTEISCNAALTEAWTFAGHPPHFNDTANDTTRKHFEFSSKLSFA